MAGIEVKGLKKLKDAMKRVEVNMPKIRAQTLNNMAGHTWALTRLEGGTLDRTFKLRNKFTQGAVRFTKASARPGSVAITGAVNYGRSDDGIGPGDYLAIQEGGERRHRVGHVPTDAARITKNKGKRVASRQKLSNKNFGEAGALIVGNRQAFIAIKQRLRTGNRQPLRMRLKGKHGTQEGLYRMKGQDLVMMQNVSKKTVSIDKKPWLRPAAIIATERGFRFFVRNFNRHLRRS